MTHRNSNRYNPKQRFYRKKSFFLLAGFLLGAGLIVATYQTSVYFSTDESCMMCHVHPHAEDSWKMSKHVNNGSGVKTHCVDCHLPPKHNTWAHYTAKAKLGIRDVWGYLTKDSADFDWEAKSQLEYACKWSPMEGHLFSSSVSHVFVNGTLAAESGQIIQKPPTLPIL